MSFSSVEEAAEKIVRVTETIEPEPELVEKYERQYQKFAKIYPTVKDLSRENGLSCWWNLAVWENQEEMETIFLRLPAIYFKKEDEEDPFYSFLRSQILELVRYEGEYAQNLHRPQRAFFRVWPQGAEYVMSSRNI